MNNKIKLAWLSGIIEGEGCFSLNSAGKDKGYFVYCISITNTDLVLLEKCVEILKEIGIKTRIKGRNKEIPNRRKRYDAKVEGLDNIKLTIEKIFPYIFGQKKLQAELMLSFVNRRIKVLKDNKGKSPRRRVYDSIDYSYLEAMKALKAESVETTRFPSQEDEDIVRTAHIYKSAELGRNDLAASPKDLGNRLRL